MDERILAVVVTYYPEKELLKNNIAAFIDDIDKVLIWENTPEDKKLQYRFIENPKVEYCGDGINSISHALNYAWKYADTHGYDYLLTMDQDSVFQNFAELKEYAYRHSNQMMLLGPWYSVKKNLSQPSVKVEALITSGMLVQMKILNSLEGYNEALTIDGVDTDLCLRANQKGIYSYQITSCFMQQRFGQSLVKIHNGKEHHFYSYPARRLRSIVKSHIYLMRKYPNMSLEMRNNIKDRYIINRIKNILLFEDQKICKIFAIFMGVVEGKTMKI